MMTKENFTVRVADWQRDRTALQAIRTIVYVDEQHVPKSLEWDGRDEEASHVLALDSEGKPIGTGRLLASGQIGRMAVLKLARGTGVGSALLNMLIEQAREQGMRECFLHAQTHAIEFYARYGFRIEGEEFSDANMPHRAMRLTL